MKAMKESVIPFLDKIPLNWEEKPIRYLFKEITDKNRFGTEKKALKFTYGSIVPKDDFDADTDNYVANTILNYTLVSKGVIMINCLNLNYDFVSHRVGLVEDTGVITSAYLAIRPNKQILSEFANYELKYFDSIKAFHNMGTGVRKTLDFSELGKKYFIYPSILEQKKIVDFLDAKCAEINKLSEDIQSEIDTLEAYKHSVITEVVTKGVDNEKKFKNSGIDGIDQIPVHWEINKIKYLFDSGKGLSITKENLTDEGLPVISYGQIHSKSNDGVSIKGELLRFVNESYRTNYPQCEIKKNDFVFADTSEDYDGCGNCSYKRDDGIIFGGYHTIILHSKNKHDNRYFAYLFQTDGWRKQIRSKASGIKVFSITQKIIMNASVVVPPYNEQLKISDKLDEICNKVNNIISDKREQLSLLLNYKNSIIYEYVTGKKEVPTT